MCLEKVYSKEKREKILSRLPGEFVAWKVVEKYKGKWLTCVQLMPLHAGAVKFEQNTIKGFNRYRGGGHFWLHYKDAKENADYDFPGKIVKCRIKKEWVNHVGSQSIGLYEDADVIVTKKAVFPKYIGGM
jgi:hypothetical protein